eukprot:scaffold586485_cov36-Prasinocladus_malaysianus.AAC.1
MDERSFACAVVLFSVAAVGASISAGMTFSPPQAAAAASLRLFSISGSSTLAMSSLTAVMPSASVPGKGLVRGFGLRSVTLWKSLRISSRPISSSMELFSS